jgi:predicted pore-forming effector associated with SMODS systems
MRKIHPEIPKIAAVSAGLFFILFSIYLFCTGESATAIVFSAGKTGIIFSAIGFFWFLYNHFLWRLKFFQFWGWLCNMPNLNGRWEGTVCRHKGDTPRPFVMEITQTFSDLSFRTWSAHSRGESLVASLFVEEVGGNTFLVRAIWRTTTRKINEPTAEDTFEGTSIWRISIDGEKKTIEDLYYTGREPQTKGAVLLEWKSYKCFNRF